MIESPPTPSITAFDSLAELGKCHAELLKAVGSNLLAPDNARQLSKFIARAVQTGRILDAADDRTQAQGLINFWVARLASAARAAGVESVAPWFNDTVLEEVAPDTIREAAIQADAWLAIRPEADQALARNIMLRLVRMPADGVKFVPVSTVKAALSDLGSPDDLARVVDGLVTVGVVRVVPGESTEMDRAMLRSPELLNSWTAFARWRDERAGFRRRADEWDRAGRGSVGDGLNDSELDEVRLYHDRDGRERAFIEACRNRDRRRRELLRGGVVLLAIVLLLIIPLAIYCAVEWGKTAKAEALAEEQNKEANIQRKLALAAAEELSRQHRFVRTVQVVRTLAEIGEATRTRSQEELSVALNRWDTLVTQLQQEEKNIGGVEHYFTDITKQFAVIRNATRLPEQKFDTAAALEVARTCRNDLLLVKDPRVQIELEAIRTAAFERVRLCVDRMLVVFRDKSFDSADPYVREFWLNYWGDMGLVEGRSVSSAMVTFGKKLNSIRDRLPEFAWEDKLEAYKKNVHDRKKEAVQPKLSAFLDPASANEANLWYRTYSRMVFVEEIKELDALAIRLREALSAEEKEPIRPYGQ